MEEGSTPRKKRRHRARKRRGKLTLADVERGIFLDFEGLVDGAPVLAGVLIPPAATLSDVEQVVLDRRFSAFGEATELATQEFEGWVTHLVERAETEDRRIIAWSEHELDIIRAWCSNAIATRFAARFRNARAFADTWRRTLHPEVEFSADDRKENALANYLDCLDYFVPASIGHGTAARNIHRLSGPASAGRAWDSLSEAQRRYWMDLLTHNQHDCVGMYCVSRRAVDEL